MDAWSISFHCFYSSSHKFGLRCPLSSVFYIILTSLFSYWVNAFMLNLKNVIPPLYTVRKRGLLLMLFWRKQCKILEGCCLFWDYLNFLSSVVTWILPLLLNNKFCCYNYPQFLCVFLKLSFSLGRVEMPPVFGPKSKLVSTVFKALLPGTLVF